MGEEAKRKVVRVRLAPEERERRDAERLERRKATEARALQSYKDAKARTAALEGKARLRERKLETRLKIVLGAYVMEHMQHDPDFKAQIGALMQRVATPAEAQLFVDQLEAITARKIAKAAGKGSPAPPAT